MAEEKANTKSIKRNYLYNMIYQVLILILPLVTTPYLSRVLGAEGIGIYGYTYAIVTYFILFGSLGVSLYGQREIAYAQENPEKRMSTFVELILFRLITIAIAIIPYAIFFIYGNNNYQFCYRILLIEIIAAAFDISWFFQGMEEFKKTVTRNVFVRVCSVTCVFLFVKTKEDLSKFILIYSLGDLIGNISLWLYLPKYFKGIKIKNIGIRKHFIPVMMLFIPQIANQVYKILDTTMIGRIIPDKTETGYYEQAQKVIRLLLTIVTSLGVVMIGISLVFLGLSLYFTREYFIRKHKREKSKSGFTFILGFLNVILLIIVAVMGVKLSDLKSINDRLYDEVYDIQLQCDELNSTIYELQQEKERPVEIQDSSETQEVLIEGNDIPMEEGRSEISEINTEDEEDVIEEQDDNETSEIIMGESVLVPVQP